MDSGAICIILRYNPGMVRFVLTLLLVLPAITLAKVATRPTTLPTTQASTTRQADAFLDPTALHVLHLKLTRKAWDDMQPARKGLFSGLFAASRPAIQGKTHDSPFGYQYAYVHAALEFAGQTFDDIGLRFKGNSSYMTGSGLKKPFKVDLNHYDAEQSLAGLPTFNLNNNAMDPTLMREALSYQFFRDAGVPASRTASALVYLTVESMHDRQLAGLYTVVEEIDKPFLKAHFGSAKGLLLKPENAFDLPYLGENFERYEKMYRPKSKTTPETTKRLMEFTKLIHQADDAAFAQKIETYLDVPGFLRFIAANAMLANMDSFLSTGHNFYLYIHPDTLKIHFMPWDLNLSFGTFDWVGSTPDQTDLSLRQPYVKPNHLTERVLSIDRYAKAYREETRRIARECLTGDRLNQQIAAMEAVIARAEKQAGVPHKALPPGRPAEIDLKTFMAKRVESVRTQLAQTNEGYTPHWTKGIFGGFQEPATKPATKPTTRPAPAKH